MFINDHSLNIKIVQFVMNWTVTQSNSLLYIAFRSTEIYLWLQI